LGKSAFFVSPCDSLAVIADSVVEVIPYFHKAANTQNEPFGTKVVHLGHRRIGEKRH